MSEEIVLRRLYWVGPATIVAAVGTVMIVQQASLLTLRDLPKFSGRVLGSNEPAWATAAGIRPAGHWVRGGGRPGPYTEV